MREIKFNLVDEETNEYVRFDEWSKNNDEPHDEGFELLARFLSFYYGFTALQYTGLKDKNGVEIFEGDILFVKVAYNCEYEYKNPDNVFNHQIKNVKIKVLFIDGGFVLDSGFIQDDKNMLWLWEDIEIIGNIYENPELLKSD